MSKEQEEKSAIDPNQADAQAADGGKGGGGVLGTLFPPDLTIWNEARRLAADKNIRVEDLAICATQDPSIVIELLRTSNAMYFAGGRSPITSTKTAIVRLGSDLVIDIFEKMSDRQQIENEDVDHWFAWHRSRCKRTAIVARILSEAVARNLADDCQTVGLFFHVGEMLAVIHFKEQYTSLAEELSRSGINYRLSQDFKFDVERMGLNYLRRHGIPEVLLFALDRDGRSRTPDRAIMKPLCQASAELVDAFDSNRWEKLAPGKTLPPKSALRMLQLPENQYLKVYERSSEYLFSARLEEERRKQVGVAPAAEPTQVSNDWQEASENSGDLNSEIENLLQGEDDIKPAPEPEKSPTKIAPPQAVVTKKPGQNQTQVVSVDDVLTRKEEVFALKKSPAPGKGKPRVILTEQEKFQAKRKPVPQTLDPEANQVLSSVANVVDKAKSAEELLSDILKMLVDDGPFEKSALIVVSKDKKHAIVVAARGPSIGSGQKLVLDDPLSPLARCFSKVQSFGTTGAKCSPFGSNTYAIAPVDADHETPVALYADCGNSGSISFEARRVFRNVIEILNSRLPQLPGGIPVEIA